MATPTLGRDGEIDEMTLQDYTQMLIDGGVNGLFPCGSIGEFSSLRPFQRRQVIETVVEASEDIPILAGCGGTSVGAVRGHVESAAGAGADAAVVVNPYYLETTQAGTEEFYRIIADQAALPIVLYNIPALTHQHIELETVVELAEVDGIVGIKDSSGDLGYHYRLVEETPRQFTVLQGATELALVSLDLGSEGLIAGPANVFPTAMAEIYAAYHRGNRSRAVELMNSLIHPFLSEIEDIPTATAIKHFLSLRDHDIGKPLPPLPELTDQQRRRLTARYEDLTAIVATAE
jgi:4-hydroxy-tetrahydrodipicolinate synthase